MYPYLESEDYLARLIEEGMQPPVERTVIEEPFNIPVQMPESGAGLSTPVPGQAPPPPRANLEEILAKRKELRDDAQRRSSIALALQNIKTDIQRAWAPVFGGAVDPSAGAGGRQAALSIRESVEPEANDLLRQYTAQKAEQDRAEQLGRTNALRGFLSEKYGIQLPEGLDQAALTSIANQEGINQRSRAAIEANRSLAEDSRSFNAEQRELDRQNRLEVASMRKRGTAGIGGGGGGSYAERRTALEQVGVKPETADMLARNPKKTAEVLVQMGKEQARAYDENLSPSDVVSLRMLGKQYNELLPLDVALSAVNDKLAKYGDDIPGIGGLGAVEPDWSRGIRASMGFEDAQKAKEVRSITDNLMDLIRRARSGAAITQQEEGFYNNLLNTGLSGTDVEFRRIVQQITDEVRAKVQNAVRSTPDRVVQYYNRDVTIPANSPAPTIPDASPETSVMGPQGKVVGYEKDTETGEIFERLEMPDGTRTTRKVR